MGLTNSVCLDKNKLDELVRVTFFKKEELKEWHRKFKNDHPNGTMDETQFKDLYTKLYAADDESDERIHHIFRFFDQGNDGFISFTALMTTLSLVRRGPIKEKMVWLFEIYDVNRSGVISKEEMNTVMKTMGCVMKGERHYEHELTHMNGLFDSIDTDGDGGLTVEEFVKGVENYPEIALIMNCGQVLPFM